MAPVPVVARLAAAAGRSSVLAERNHGILLDKSEKSEENFTRLNGLCWAREVGRVRGAVTSATAQGSLKFVLVPLIAATLLNTCINRSPAVFA